MDEQEHPFVSADMEELLKKAFQSKIWAECAEGFNRLPISVAQVQNCDGAQDRGQTLLTAPYAKLCRNLYAD